MIAEGFDDGQTGSMTAREEGGDEDEKGGEECS
jgi:hypothetical protein